MHLCLRDNADINGFTTTKHSLFICLKRNSHNWVSSSAVHMTEWREITDNSDFTKSNSHDWWYISWFTIDLSEDKFIQQMYTIENIAWLYWIGEPNFAWKLKDKPLISWTHSGTNIKSLMLQTISHQWRGLLTDPVLTSPLIDISFGQSEWS